AGNRDRLEDIASEEHAPEMVIVPKLEGRNASWSCRNVGSSSAPSPGSRDTGGSAPTTRPGLQAAGAGSSPPDDRQKHPEALRWDLVRLPGRVVSHHLRPRRIRRGRRRPASPTGALHIPSPGT